MSCLRRTSATQPGSSLKAEVKHNQSASLQRPSIEEPRIADASRGDIPARQGRTRATQPGKQKPSTTSQQVSKGHPSRSRGLPMPAGATDPLTRTHQGNPTRKAEVKSASKSTKAIHRTPEAASRQRPSNEEPRVANCQPGRQSS